jgi:dTDP-L-rhamnose 4-epimerase
MELKNVLVTGGAGFIGSHVVDQLLDRGYRVRVLDKLVEQVHMGQAPRHLSEEAELMVGDMRDAGAMARALEGMDAVLNLAAEVGVGQSMYEIVRYMDGNTGGTAVLLELLATGQHEVQRMVVASSMSIYGEGMYECAEHGFVAPSPRPDAQLVRRDWELRCGTCAETVTPVPTDELKPVMPTSIYAISKLDQELMSLAVGRAYGIGTVALRFFNTYGPRQALSNPYTGVAAIFSSRLLNNRAPVVFEDGQQARDFIHVDDTARAVVLAMEAQSVSDTVCNIGTGNKVTVAEVAARLASEMGLDIEPEISQNSRAGDIRHCWADASRAKDLLGFEAKTTFDAGVEELIDWVRLEQAVDSGESARAELFARGLAR